MKLTFVRHGQTDWNKQKKLMGRTDIELNDKGRAQAAEVVKVLDGDFDVLYSSPLKRAYQTAQAISEHFQKPIIVHEDLSERDFGSLQGKSWAEIQEATGIDMKTITKEEGYDYRPYGGESAEDVKMRLLRFFDEYIEFQAPDLEAVKKFYTAVFGWTFTDYGPAYAAFNDGALDGGFEQGERRAGGAPLIILYSENLAATQEAIEKAGGQITKAAYSFPGGRRFHFADPAGNELAVWSEK